MASAPASPDLADVERRFAGAVRRLEGSLSALNRRLSQLSAAEAEVKSLAAERNRLAAELDKANVRAKALDDSAAEVARRLVGAMEEVRSVLDKEGV